MKPIGYIGKASADMLRSGEISGAALSREATKSSTVPVFISSPSETVSEIELKICPFCGSSDRTQDAWSVKCIDCGAEMPGDVDRARNAWNRRQSDFDARIRSAIEPFGQWRDGAPPKPWCDEWFIAETTYGDRVVLRSLPEEWSYDFKTADDTYIKADRIKRWMQFPDSEFSTPPAEPVTGALDRAKVMAAAEKANHAYGQWMPERWLHLFLEAYEGKK